MFIFWPGQHEDCKTDLAAQARPQRTQQERPKPSAEELYQTALLHKEPGDSPRQNYRILVHNCRRILKEYPDSPQAEKARELLQDVRRRCERRFVLRYGIACRPTLLI